MNTKTPLENIRVVCPRCSAANRVPQGRMKDGPRCGGCKEALFEGHPVELTGADLQRHVAGSDIPIVVDFWAPWCGPCRAMAPVFGAAAMQFEPNARFVKLNTDSDQEWSSRMDIRGIPTLIIFKDGKEVARAAGAMDAGRFGAWLKAHL